MADAIPVIPTAPVQPAPAKAKAKATAADADIKSIYEGAIAEGKQAELFERAVRVDN